VSRSALRIVILLAGLSIAGIVITQVYWVRRAFDIRENQFNRDVNIALRAVAEKLFQVHHTPQPFNNPIDQVSTNYFIVKTNYPVDNALLEFLLVSEFEKRNITEDFEYGVYDCMENCMVGGNYISPKKAVLQWQRPPLPAVQKDGYYFGVQFPKLKADLIGQLGIWGFSSAVMLIVVFFFVYSLFVMLKQRRLSEIQKDFINNMTHEFKTPISTIAISAGVLKDPSIIGAPERLLSYATIIERENNRLGQQVERVLQIATLDRKDIGLKKEYFSLHVLLRSVISHMTLALQEKQGRVTFFPESGYDTVSADPLHLTNVLYNLLDNATKYTQKSPEIFVRTSSDQGNVYVEIQDNGLGITVENQKKIFQRFYRVPTGNVHDTKGFGLGLHYARVIAEAHGGSIAVESEPGKGSTFTLVLPWV
jgi:two-component system phosphate regulon sensor histidine kinase PhoR